MENTDNNVIIRAMLPADITAFPEAFAMQGWDKPRSQYEHYFKEQENKSRQVFVAQIGGQPAGYATLLPEDDHGPFAGLNIPAVRDFNVLEKYQKRGIGSAILDRIEACVGEYSDRICLGVGLHSGYGPAQRLYILRGYIPDGSGVWYRNKLLDQYVQCFNDDDLVLYLSKELRRL